jgi:Ca2+-transporting ATPase
MSNWHSLNTSTVLAQLNTDPNLGLSEAEATRRLSEYGTNELIERGLKSPWLILWEQFAATMVVILIIAAVISAAMGDYKDAVAIMAIVLLNAILGFNQEYRAEKAMAALKRMARPIVKVQRSGHIQEISARELVPGDIVLLEAGNLVPADCRLLESANLRTEEAALTGESEPVDKDPLSIAKEDVPLGDRRNMAYMGTVVAYGRGRAVIAETGMQTELGRIAELIQTAAREQTPLQRRLDQLGRALAIAALILVAIIFSLGMLRGEPLRLMFLTSVSMAVAAVPEGLPAVVTIALALGAQRMLKRRALIRKLPAVETLGSVTVICSDKTGTLTESRMTVTVLDVAGHRLDLTEQLYRAAPALDSREAITGAVVDRLSLTLLLSGGALCNDALLEPDSHKPGQFRAMGDPTEGALVVCAAQLGLWKGELERVLPRVAEVPFDSQRKRMTTVHKLPDPKFQVPVALGAAWDWHQALGSNHGYLAFTKGAVDSLLEISRKVWVDEHAEPLTEEWRRRIVSANDQLAQDGMRVLGVAFRPLQLNPAEEGKDSLEQDLIFVGMVGMIDPPRPEVKQAVGTCKDAGIRPVMITGDHPLTARHIARELDIATDGQILTGQDLARLPIKELEDVAEEASIYARVSPEHKLNIVQALQNRGHIVAMTGDGVNDAPALKKADIGVAMGITGTDVSKEAADMILLDDNFATIVAAVEEGRVIYDNIRRFIKFLLSCNSGEIWVMLLAPFLGMPLPLLPLQILWMNLVTDGLPALALGVEPAERNVMRRPPHSPKESIFGRGMGRDIIWIGLLCAMVTLGVGYCYWKLGRPQWQTMVFTTLTFSQMALALAVRSERDSLFSIGLLSNKSLLGAVVLSFALQMAVIYIPFLAGFFKTVSLSLTDLILCLALSSVVFWGVELKKRLIRRCST